MGIHAMYDSWRHRKDESARETWTVTFTVDGLPDSYVYHSEKEAIHGAERLRGEQAVDVVIHGPRTRCKT